MTFGLKELSDLRKNFDDTVDIILKREGKGKIEDLSNPHRKFELQFLGSILLKIEEQVKEKVRAEEQVKSHQTIINLTNAYYGAMLTVMQDIENNRSLIESPGLLNDRLKDAIGIGDEVKQEDKPDLYQIAKFHTALNAFLSQIFIGHDSRNGFAKEHMLTVIPTDDLNKLIQTSYKLEKDAQHAIVASFTAEGQIAPEHHKFKANKKSPVSAIHRFGGWDKLNADLDELIKEELADKNVAKIEKLRSRERVAQLHFLNKIRESLEKSLIDEAEKTAVLAGSMHLVRQQIKNGYASSYIGNEDNSVILTGKKKKKGLNQILAIDEVNPQDVEALVTSAIQYIQFMTVEPKITVKKSSVLRIFFQELRTLI